MRILNFFGGLGKLFRTIGEVFFGLVKALLIFALQGAIVLLAFTVAACIVWTVWHFGGLGLERLHALTPTGHLGLDIAIVYGRAAIYLCDVVSILLAIAILAVAMANLSTIDINKLF